MYRELVFIELVSHITRFLRKFGNGGILVALRIRYACPTYFEKISRYIYIWEAGYFFKIPSLRAHLFRC